MWVHARLPGGRLDDERQALQDERYARFVLVLRAANAALAAIYRRLVGGQGDARLTYADDRLLLFSDGITLHVRRAPGAGDPLLLLQGASHAHMDVPVHGLIGQLASCTSRFVDAGPSLQPVWFD